MLAIDPQELTDMRAELAQTWPDTALVKRRSPSTSDGRGGVTGSFATVATVGCRLIPKGGAGAGVREGTEAAKLTAVTEWTVLLPFDTGVRPGDRLEIATLIYEVLEDNGDRSHPLMEAVRVRRAK